MKTNNQKKSILQTACSILLFIALFLPWVSLSIQIDSLKGSKTISFFDVFNFIAQTGSKVSEWSSYTDHSINNYALLFYVIPILLIINIIVQLIKNEPILSFYASVIPTVLSYTLLYYGFSYQFDDQILNSPGTIITLTAGSIAIIEAWIQIGYSSKKYKGYLFFLVGCILLGVIGAIIDSYGYRFLHHKGSDTFTSSSSQFILLLLTITQYIGAFGYLHMPFFIIGGIGMAIAAGKKHDQYIQESSNDDSQISILKNKETPSIPSPIKQEDTTLDESTSKDTNQEDDNLRFAPPQYRK